jgi:8-oxo-dGTP pyrophosphatase MutT (NUDIX family)
MPGLTSTDNDIDEYNIDVNDNDNLDNENLDNEIIVNENNQLDETNTDENNQLDGNNTDEHADMYNGKENEKETKNINTYKVILVQRRNTIGFIEFMRGKYEADNYEYIIKLFNMLTFDEKRILREYDAFDTIRKIIGLCRDNIYKREYDDAKAKFEALRNNADGNMIFKLLDKSITRWNSPEWGIPKGRRKVWIHHGFGANANNGANGYNTSGASYNGRGELDIECAIREFVEETGIMYKNLIVYRNVKPLEELYKGINGVLYKHIYYLATVKDTKEGLANIENVERGGNYNFEVGNVKCFGLSECHRIIRPYYVSKLNVIKKGFQLINCIKQYFE